MIAASSGGRTSTPCRVARACACVPSTPEWRASSSTRISSVRFSAGMPPALARLREAADHDDDLFMCPVVFYELWRGLSYRGADRQLEELNAFAGTLQWVDYDRAMWVEAARLWIGVDTGGLTTTPTC